MGDGDVGCCKIFSQFFSLPCLQDFPDIISINSFSLRRSALNSACRLAGTAKWKKDWIAGRAVANSLCIPSLLVSYYSELAKALSSGRSALSILVEIAEIACLESRRVPSESPESVELQFGSSCEHVCVGAYLDASLDTFDSRWLARDHWLEVPLFSGQWDSFRPAADVNLE